jgi:hypothetical protein
LTSSCSTTRCRYEWHGVPRNALPRRQPAGGAADGYGDSNVAIALPKLRASKHLPKPDLMARPSTGFCNSWSSCSCPCPGKACPKTRTGRTCCWATARRCWRLRANRRARHRGPVLTAAKGTGKKLVARVLFEPGRLGRLPLKVNRQAFDGPQLEDELFGYEADVPGRTDRPACSSGPTAERAPPTTSRHDADGGAAGPSAPVRGAGARGLGASVAVAVRVLACTAEPVATLAEGGLDRVGRPPPSPPTFTRCGCATATTISACSPSTS